jgi:hypothetical protein
MLSSIPRYLRLGEICVWGHANGQEVTGQTLSPQCCGNKLCRISLGRVGAQHTHGSWQEDEQGVYLDGT